MGKLGDYKKDNELDDIEFDDEVDELDQMIEEQERKQEKKEESKSKINVNEIEKIEEKILSIILNNQKVPEGVNEHLFSTLRLKEVYQGIEHFSSQSEEGVFDSGAVGALLSKRRNNSKWEDEIIPNLVKISKGKTNHLQNYLSILKEQNIGIKANKIAEAIRDKIKNGDLSYLKQAATELNSIELFEDSGYDTLEDALNSAIFNIDEKRDSDGEHSGIPTGIETLDDTTGGLQKSDLIILAARPGQGKTATAINFAYNGKVPCGFISSEMPSEQLALRLLSLDSGVNAQKIRNPKKLLPDELQSLRESSEKMKKDTFIYIDDKPGISIQEVKEKAKIWKEKYDIQVLYIDYIQRLTYKAPGADKMPRSERIGMIAMEAKEIARELDIAVVGLAQISRGAEKNEASGGRPMLSDLKDSGMIEQEADLVICPFRENMDGMDVNAVAEMEILLLKNRHGPLGEIDAVWIPRNMKIVEADDYDVDSGTVSQVTEDAEEEDIPY
tara:strand:+ start:46022 stop:47521 length:1500 start_codon:yes stop_codon:yes gene_type:complete